MNGFDLLAPIYDRLARLVFGRSIVDSQTVFLHHVKSGDRVLILGGGTGWLLAELVRHVPDCEIWYIESSNGMLDVAKQKVNGSNTVHFVLGTHRDIPLMKFDVVITHFFLDMFSQEELPSVLSGLSRVLHQQSIWLATDFENEGKWWQGVLTKMMIVFFRAFGVKAGHLPTWRKSLSIVDMHEVEMKFYYKGFIKATFYKRR